MNFDPVENLPIRPDVVRRTCGGWLAVAPNGTSLAIAVTAATHDAAVEKFGFVFQRWVEILRQKELDVPKQE
jgi:hypothetical protein